MNTIRNSRFPDPADNMATTDPNEELPRGLLETLWRRRWTILATGLLALAAGLLYIQRATPRYESTSRIYVELSMPRVFREYEEGVLNRATNYLHTQAELLNSTPILSDAMRRGDLTQLQTFAGVSNKMTMLRKGLETVVGKKDDLISVSFKSPYAAEAAHIVNTVVDAYLTFHSQRKRNSAAELVKILKQEKSIRDTELNDRLQVMMDFKRTSESLAFGSNQDNNVILRSLERLSLALTEAQLATVESKSFYALVQQLEDDPRGLQEFVEAQRLRGSYAPLASEVAALRAEVRQFERTRDRCLRELEPAAPAIVALEAEIAKTRQEINELEKEFARSQMTVAEQKWQADLEREKELAKQFEQVRQQAVQLNGQIAQYTILESEYEQTRKLCDTLDDRIKELSVIEETGALNVTVLETAEPAMEPSEPQKAKAMMLALGLGLFAGTGLALLREWRDQRLRSTQEISALLGLPVLGSIPAMGGSRQAPSERGQKVRHSPGSREAEAFRTVRTAIFFRAPKEEIRTILVTSPAPGEGKSTSAANLGIAMAQAGQKVLILDADFRRPMQHTIFGLNRERKGLGLVLTGKMTLSDAIDKSEVDNLDVLTSGPHVSNPAEMLNSNSFRQILEKLVGKYDRVLIDSPPVAAVTDALILAARCDVTVLVLRAETSTRGGSIEACKALASVDAKVIGVVVNDVPRKGDRYGYSAGYHYYSDHSSDGNGQKKRDAQPAGLGNGRPIVARGPELGRGTGR